MNVTIRLYKKQDLDLISLYQCPGFSLAQTIRSVINSCASANPIQIDLPDEQLYIPLSQLKQSIQFHIIFTEEKDGAATIDFLKRVLPGYRNNFIKNLIRCYMNGMQMHYYFVNSEVPVNKGLSFHSEAEKTAAPATSVNKKQKKEKKKTTVSTETVIEQNIPVNSVQKEIPEATIIHIEAPIPEKDTEKTEDIPMVTPIKLSVETEENDTKNTAEQQDDFDLFGSIENMLSNM